MAGVVLTNAKTSENLLRSSAYKCSTQNRPCQNRVSEVLSTSKLPFKLSLLLANKALKYFGYCFCVVVVFFSCLNSCLKDLLNSCAYNFHKCYLAKG